MSGCTWRADSSARSSTAAVAWITVLRLMPVGGPATFVLMPRTSNDATVSRYDTSSSADTSTHRACVALLTYGGSEQPTLCHRLPQLAALGSIDTSGMTPRR
jgi:hypothetical protein